MTTAIELVIDRLQEEGATLVEERTQGAFGKLKYHVGGLVILLESDYGEWHVNIGLAGKPLFPASFWMAALDGDDAYPDPPVTQEDVTRTADRLHELVQRSPEAVAKVARFGQEYSSAMRERMGPT